VALDRRHGTDAGCRLSDRFAAHDFFRSVVNRASQASHSDGFFDSVRHAAARAHLRAAGFVFTRTYDLAGLSVRVVLAGPPLVATLTRALAHAESPATGTPDLTILAWDTRSTGVGLPPAPCSEGDIRLRGEITTACDERFQAAYFCHARMLCTYDAERKLGLLGVVDATRIPAFERTCPFRAILGWFFRQHGHAFVHAAAVGTAAGAVVLGGRSGVGKSTTAIRCLLAGLEYLGDDVTCLSSAGPAVHGIYSSGKTHGRDWAALPELEPLAEPRPTTYDKEHYFLAPHFPGLFPRSRPIRAIVIPDHSGGRLGFDPLPAPAVVAPIAASTTTLLPSAGGEVLAMIAAVARQVPCYRFHLGSDPRRIPAALADLIDGLTDHAASRVA